jgi:oligopeptide transport system ATP-binding protein
MADAAGTTGADVGGSPTSGARVAGAATAILDVRNLTTEIPTSRGTLTVVDDVSFAVAQGECFGLVGESGSGKSMTLRSILGLIPPPGRVTAGEVLHGGRDLTTMSARELTSIRGRDIAMIVQDAVSALNPVYRIGRQIGEPMLEHHVVRSRRAARDRAISLMTKVGIPAPEKRVDDFPHQFSGGMCQRVVIATALACDPGLILADEPTTALDVTIQDQILKLLVALQRDLDLSLLLVTHDMGVVAQTCQRVAVMYGGQIVELVGTEELFRAPRHPYTAGLLNCVPRLDGPTRRLKPIAGSPPDLAEPPSGCRFHPRCPLALDTCRTQRPELVEVAPGHFSRCLRHDAMTPDLWERLDA